MKTPGPGIRGTAMLCVMFVLSACGLQRVADTASSAAPEELAPPDLPAAMTLMQPQEAYTDLAELRHFSAYNAFHAMKSSGSSGSAASDAPAACFGNQ